MASKKSAWGGARDGSGRKPLGKEKATENVMLRFTPEQMKAVTKAAKGERIAVFLKDLVLKAVSRRK